MAQASDWKLLRISLGESDKYGRKPRYQAIVELLRKEGMAGATVLRGITGFGATSVVHKRHLAHLSDDRPLVIEVVDSFERIEAVLPKLEPLLGGGLVTLERIEVVTDRGAPSR